MQEILNLNEMSVADKLSVINEIWESIEQENNAIPSPHWHKDILLIRSEKIKNGIAKFKSFDIVKEELRAKFK